MMSTWRTVAPPATAACASSPSRAKSAERMEGASSIMGMLIRPKTESASHLGFRRLHLCHFFDQAEGDPIASEAAHGASIVFAFDDGQPGDAVIEHGRRCDDKGILESDIDRIRGQKVN